MIQPEVVKEILCRTFCSEIEARVVPVGIALSTAFLDNSGDPIGFYLIEGPDGFHIEDDGHYLGDLIASGIQIDNGTRGQLLQSILKEADAYWDHDSFEIRTDSFPEAAVGQRLVRFVSALVRVRDLELLTRENIRSTFREDTIYALQDAFGEAIIIDENKPIRKSLSEFPVDIIVGSKLTPERQAAIYLASTNDKLNEALLFRMELDAKRVEETKVFALIEEPDMRTISRRIFQRAQNRGLAMPIFRGDEAAAISRIGREIGL